MLSKRYRPTAEYKIVTTATVDREERAEYHLTVTCRDSVDDVINQVSSGLESSREIVVVVLDENDNAPQFDLAEFNVTVPENGPAGTELYRLNATDADFGPNAKVSYSIRALDGAAADLLSVDPTSGLVSTRVSFDYETLPPRELAYEVMATDGGDPALSSTAILRLFVEDTNDARPLFERSSYHFNVSEDASSGTTVGRVVAKDADSSPRYSAVVYRTGHSNGGGDGAETGSDFPFEVDSSSGEIRTLGRLDRERCAVYVFNVEAVNRVGYDVTMASSRHGNQPEVDVTVYVDDVNDNRPTFLFPGQERGSVAYLSSSLIDRVSRLSISKSVSRISLCSMYAITYDCKGVTFAIVLQTYCKFAIHLA